MPYLGERAPRLGHVSTVNSKAVESALAGWQVSAATTSADDLRDLVRPLEKLHLLAPIGRISHALTVDGSDQEIKANDDHPSVKVGYVKVAGSLVRLDDYRALGDDRFVDPVRLRRTYDAHAFDAALPGSGLVRPGMSGVETWRHELDEFLGRERFDGESPKTLADGLLQLLNGAGVTPARAFLGKCPACGAKTDQGFTFEVTRTGGTCPNCLARLYLSDVLRTWEDYDPEGSNTRPMTLAMSMAERLTTLCYMDFFLERGLLGVLDQTLFVTDGPLALHGPTAPLSRSFVQYHSALTQQAKDAGGAGPYLVGIEKSGRFVENAKEIVRQIAREAIPESVFPRRSVMRLTTPYINRVTGRPAGSRYGKDDFYGRRFVYRASTGAVLVLTVPARPGVSPYDGSDAAESFEAYPTLRLICEVLDTLLTRMYEDAVVPIALAHSAASLPLGVGQSVLRELAQLGLRLPVTTVTQPRNPYAKG